jgi:hypothetical protein
VELEVELEEGLGGLSEALALQQGALEPPEELWEEDLPEG